MINHCHEHDPPETPQRKANVCCVLYLFQGSMPEAFFCASLFPDHGIYGLLMFAHNGLLSSGCRCSIHAGGLVEVLSVSDSLPSQPRRHLSATLATTSVAVMQCSPHTSIDMAKSLTSRAAVVLSRAGLCQEMPRLHGGHTFALIGCPEAEAEPQVQVSDCF